MLLEEHHFWSSRATSLHNDTLMRFSDRKWCPTQGAMVWHCSSTMRSRDARPETLPALRLALHEAWDGIPQEVIARLVVSMRRWCTEVREAHGGHTRYWPHTLCIHSHARISSKASQWPPPTYHKMIALTNYTQTWISRQTVIRCKSTKFHFAFFFCCWVYLHKIFKG